MGYADRDYTRLGPQRPPSRLAGAPVVKWLLIVNVAVFVIEILLTENAAPGRRPPPNAIEIWGWFTIASGFEQFQLWRLVSFQFLHAGWMHILFNMYGLFLFGPFAERWWRSRPFLAYYLLCGIAGAVVFTLIAFLPGILPDASVQDRLVGASAGLMGVLIAVAVISPEGRIMLLIPPIPMKMRTFAIVYIVMDTVIVLTNYDNAGGSVAHLGGALAGFLFMKVPFLRNLLVKLATGMDRSGPTRKKPKKAKMRRSYERKLRPSSTVTKAEASEVDRILDKINEEGLHSLTEEERILLQKASGKK